MYTEIGWFFFNVTGGRVFIILGINYNYYNGIGELAMRYKMSNGEIVVITCLVYSQCVQLYCIAALRN